MVSKTVQITQAIIVTVDETKFTEAFMAEFRRDFFHFETMEEHILHLGQLYARGIVDDNDFIEGYGPAKDMGILFDAVEVTGEIVP